MIVRELSKSQLRRFAVQKDPKKRARVTRRHESAVKYNRKHEKEVVTNELTTSIED